MTDINFSFSLLMSVILFIISVISFINSRKDDNSKDVENTVRVNLKLDEICRTTNETRADIKSMRNDINDIQEEQIKQKMQIEALWKEVDVLNGNKE